MGRGRAKAKQVKVARQLKYNSGGTDLERLRDELGVRETPATMTTPTTTSAMSWRIGMPITPRTTAPDDDDGRPAAVAVLLCQQPPGGTQPWGVLFLGLWHGQPGRHPPYRADGPPGIRPLSPHMVGRRYKTVRPSGWRFGGSVPEPYDPWQVSPAATPPPGSADSVA